MKSDCCKKTWLNIVAVVLVTAVGLILRWQGIWYESGDFQSCLSIWMDNLESGNSIKVLSQYTGDYNMPYVTILWLLTFLPIDPIISIKCFSIFFDVICASGAGALVMTCCQNKRRYFFTLTYAIVFLAPVSILNSGFWGQCDSVYSAFVLWAFWCMLHKRYGFSMVLWGCALAFKLQAVFAFPLLLMYYWKNRKFSLFYFLLIPITMELLCLPAIIGGCSPLVTFSVYLSQMKTFPEMYYFYPNFWTFFQEAPYYIFGKMAVMGTFILLLLQTVFILTKERELGAEQFGEYFVWIVMTVLCFLPCMHERYGYMLEIGAVIYAVTDKKKWWFALGIQLISALMYAPGILGYALIDARILAFFYLVLFLALTYGIIGRRKQYV